MDSLNLLSFMAPIALAVLLPLAAYQGAQRSVSNRWRTTHFHARTGNGTGAPLSLSLSFARCRNAHSVVCHLRLRREELADENRSHLERAPLFSVRTVVERAGGESREQPPLPRLHPRSAPPLRRLCATAAAALTHRRVSRVPCGKKSIPFISSAGVPPESEQFSRHQGHERAHPAGTRPPALPMRISVPSRPRPPLSPSPAAERE